MVGYLDPGKLGLFRITPVLAAKLALFVRHVRLIQPATDYRLPTTCLPGPDWVCLA
jgi:hypothetical protein